MSKDKQAVQEEQAIDEEVETAEQTTEQTAEQTAEQTEPLKNIDLAPDIDALITERDELQDRLLRALAEAENLRKRGERDRRDAETYGSTRLARDLLPVYDNIDRALGAVTEEMREIAGPVLEGIELTQRDLIAAFSRHRIEPVSPDIGEKFDPKRHQAMFEAPIPNTSAGAIIQIVTTGFVIGDRLLRPAQVGVSSGGPKVDMSKDEDDESAEEET